MADSIGGGFDAIRAAMEANLAAMEHQAADEPEPAQKSFLEKIQAAAPDFSEFTARKLMRKAKGPDRPAVRSLMRQTLRTIKAQDEADEAPPEPVQSSPEAPPPPPQLSDPEEYAGVDFGRTGAPKILARSDPEPYASDVDFGRTGAPKAELSDPEEYEGVDFGRTGAPKSLFRSEPEAYASEDFGRTGKPQIPHAPLSAPIDYAGVDLGRTKRPAPQLSDPEDYAGDDLSRQFFKSAGKGGRGGGGGSGGGAVKAPPIASQVPPEIPEAELAEEGASMLGPIGVGVGIGMAGVNAIRSFGRMAGGAPGTMQDFMPGGGGGHHEAASGHAAMASMLALLGRVSGIRSRV